MKVIGVALLIVCVPVLIVSANEPSLGDRRLFFSAQERKTMGMAGEGSGLESAASDRSKGNRANDKIEATTVAAQSSPHSSKKTSDQQSDYIVNGFVETSDFLTLFVNGRPCEKISLALEAQLPINCDQFPGRSLPTLTLEKIDEYHLAVKISDGKVVTISRQVK